MEEIRIKVASLERSEWQTRFSWVKAHIGEHGNEIVNKVAKEAAGVPVQDKNIKEYQKGTSNM